MVDEKSRVASMCCIATNSHLGKTSSPPKLVCDHNIGMGLGVVYALASLHGLWEVRALIAQVFQDFQKPHESVVCRWP